MKTYSDVASLVTVFLVILLISVSNVSQANSPEVLGTQVWNVGEIPPHLLEKTTGRYFGIYGNVRFQSNGRAMILDPARPEMFIEVDLRRLAVADRRRISGECVRNVCSEIMLGLMAYGRFEPRISAPFQSTREHEASPVSPGVTTLQDSRSDWRCRDMLHCI
jgi:hypothetical protein